MSEPVALFFGEADSGRRFFIATSSSRLASGGSCDATNRNYSEAPSSGSSHGSESPERARMPAHVGPWQLERTQNIFLMKSGDAKLGDFGLGSCNWLVSVQEVRSGEHPSLVLQ